MTLSEPCPDLAVFCAESAEYLNVTGGQERAGWVLHAPYYFSAAWCGFDSPEIGKPNVQASLQQTTPEAFRQRNLFCGDRVLLSKYDFAQASRARLATS